MVTVHHTTHAIGVDRNMHRIYRFFSEFQLARLPWPLPRLLASLCTTGLLLGTLFFAASLTPSLLPRSYGMQGVLSGLSLAAGYGLGVAARQFWSWLELPTPDARRQRILNLSATVLCLITLCVFVWQAGTWQNDIRELMELEPADSAHTWRMGFIAGLVFLMLLGVARLFHGTRRGVARRLPHFIPPRIAIAAGVLVTVVIFWTVIDGVLLRYALRAADTSFQQIDALVETDTERPADPLRTGSDASLVAWEDLGRTGRGWISSAPQRGQIERFLQSPARSPVRVYVGLNSADSPADRAELALQELLRVSAFERSVLVLVTPTGTGWIDPSAITTLEYLHRGDVASVAVQYSYLPSWLSLLAEPEYGQASARAVFSEIYGYWRDLPAHSRPRLYLHGLSLGALNSARAADLYDVIGDPFHGALWSGPPFRSETWRTMTDQRQADSPAWLPRFRDGSIVRFANQNNPPSQHDAPWGPMRIVYLQYASDPITFFEPQSFYRQPQWLDSPRGPDVSDQLRWYPVVTMLQLAIDMGAADTAPRGYGHVYAAEDYIEAWVEVTDLQDWSTADIERLKQYFTRSRQPR